MTLRRPTGLGWIVLAAFCVGLGYFIGWLRVQ
jgi:hypothetical protein